MDKAVVTVKGQVVIPSRLRRRFGIKKGTQVYLYEREGEIVLKPITDEYIRTMAGMTGTKGRLLKALMAEKAKEREL
ncbi:AbrB family transcriptional regulator [Candidatus Methylomirabilis limnetica]|jgi:AbrB family looped-hinge helix DNA binding protein|uniref:AbrB family transcriptional regulator n=1 Tax=Candidatus Methylomirabilis limnetica TaxID=2033718 RepID=A0A2T4TZK4_9BACT|nr:AbrB/MazE/SpoVT family DNA-binding domain-containing protein [Candidatus Methylomirabilis limnetica]PTL36546.1 AbrB family transcriptional regulator [Candidatus Methylomirabilis limnetica]